jgi:cysteine synthase A
LNQFESMGNYRFHYYVTGNSVVEAIKEMEEEGIGNGRVSAFVSAMGSGGTIAAGDLLKQKFYETNIIGLEPIQCRTIFSNGYGGHDIQGIGDKHVTWVHNVMNMDAIMCIDDMESKEGLWLLSDPEGQEYLANDIGISEDKVRFMSDVFGISAICNILGAIKTAKYYGFGSRDNIVTIATDSLDRYHSVMNNMQEAFGKMDKIKAASSYRGVFQGAKLDYIEEGTVRTRERWTNLKYYTWVEQQGKTLQELNAQKSQEWWIKHQELIGEFDKKLKAARGE